MSLLRSFAYASIVLAACVPAAAFAWAQGKGPFVPHRGMQITTIFANEFGRDAQSTIAIADVDSHAISVDYTSTRGLVTRRDILVSDRQAARNYVLGYAASMPRVIPGSTSLGISAAVLQELRAQGAAALTLIHSADLGSIDCHLTTVAVDKPVPLLIEDRVRDVLSIEADATCAAGVRTGRGRLIFANDLANPVLIESNLEFSWEQRARTERVTRVSAGQGMHAEMVQSLDTAGFYEAYGLQFEFDSASLTVETALLVREIAAMLQANPNWVIRITGHTDSMGGADYNLKLSTERAQSIRQALIDAGVASNRLFAEGAGESKPKADNATMAGRAFNRRVEFRRLDR